MNRRRNALVHHATWLAVLLFGAVPILWWFSTSLQPTSAAAPPPGGPGELAPAPPREGRVQATESAGRTSAALEGSAPAAAQELAASPAAAPTSTELAPAPPESAVIRAVDPGSIPADARARLDQRLATRSAAQPEPPALPPVDPAAARGLVRPLDEQRRIGGAPLTNAPIGTEERLGARVQAATKRP